MLDEKDEAATAVELRALERYLVNTTADAANSECLGRLARELRNLLTTATLAIGAIKLGDVPIDSATAVSLDECMSSLRSLVHRSLVDVRLTAGMSVRREPISLAALVDELQSIAALDANARGVGLSVTLADGNWELRADQQMIASALSNLLSNAIKSTRKGGLVMLRTRRAGDRILIEVEDECGGVPTDEIEVLFKPFEQQSPDRSGLGLGLAIIRFGVEANDGSVRVLGLAGKGCVFTVDLPCYPDTSS